MSGAAAAAGSLPRGLRPADDIIAPVWSGGQEPLGAEERAPGAGIPVQSTTKTLTRHVGVTCRGGSGAGQVARGGGHEAAIAHPQ